MCNAVALAEVGGWERLKHLYMEAVAKDTYRGMVIAANYTYNDTGVTINHTYHSVEDTTNFTTCGMPNPRAFNIFQPAQSSSYPWPGMVIGLTILATNAWCTDQVCTQQQNYYLSAVLNIFEKLLYYKESFQQNQANELPYFATALPIYYLLQNRDYNYNY